MEAFLLFLFVFPACLLGSPRTSAVNSTGRSRAKVVEDYVLSADFNSLLFPQIRSTPNLVGESLLPSSAKKRNTFSDEEDDDFAYEYQQGLANEKGNQLMERDLVVHGHHPPPPPAVISPYSLFAIGFIGFLTLLGTLQASLALMTTQKQGGLLGGLGKPSGRRKRSLT